MPRVRKPELSVTDAPVELVDRDHPLWEDVKASRAWFLDRGFSVPARFDVGPVNRHSEAVMSWGLANGCRHDKYPMLIDWHKLRAAGVEPPSGGARERLRFAGVTFDSDLGKRWSA